MAEDVNSLRTWIEIDRQAIKKNYYMIRALISKKTQLMAVVKSNAYGHDLVPFAREMEKLGVDYLGVDSIVEGIALREAGIETPILVLGHTLPGRFSDAIRYNIEMTISDKATLKALAPISRMISVHIKADTGMHRQGFGENEITAVLSVLKKHKHITVKGLYTHFAVAKNPKFSEYTNRQLSIFTFWRDAFKNAGIYPIVHASATSGALLFPNAHFDMVRIGIGMYGLWPSKEVRESKQDDIPLIPVLSWKTVVGEIKGVSKGSFIGYDLTKKLSRDTRIAVCPVGYWHGYRRSFSGIGHVLVKAKRARVLGRVSMDMVVVDCTDIPGVRVGNEVVLIGRYGKEVLSADNLAEYANASNYEIITCLNPKIARLYK